MLEFVFVAVITALIAAFVVLFIAKIGAREWVQVHAPKIIAQMFSCDFCLSWWLCLAIAIGFCIGMGNPVLILSAVCATPIARILI